MPRPPRAAALLIAFVAAAGCAGGSGGSAGAEASAPTGRPLAALTGQRIVVTPVASVREGDPMGWAASIPRQREWRQQLDQAIAAELGARGLEQAWVYPPALTRAYDRNPTLSPDPYRLSIQSVTGITKATGEQRVPDPLASQLRTLVAVHDSRFVLLPVQAAFEAAGEGGGRGALRLVLVDARTAEVRWAGEVRSDVFPTFNPEVRVSLAARLADLIAAP